jgi:hypothetical protein
MARYKLHLNTKPKYMLGFASLLLIMVICVASSFREEDDFELARQEILLRKIGHEILLHSGDSVSRVLPVKKLANNEYQLRFENEFTFQTDSLVQIIRRSLEKDNMMVNYVVNVLNCSGDDVLFGYAIFEKEKDNIIPCSGRKQPKGCYVVKISFQNTGATDLSKGYLIGGLSLFAFMGLLVASPFKLRRNRSQGEPVNDADGIIQIGNTLFDASKRLITISGIATELTPKENKLLRIFADSPNDIIERSRLQKEIWEDEGVIVGRSLDVFISKLRKKLENDQSIRLLNVHGKGYKLEISD